MVHQREKILLCFLLFAAWAVISGAIPTRDASVSPRSLEQFLEKPAGEGLVERSRTETGSPSISKRRREKEEEEEESDGHDEEDKWDDQDEDPADSWNEDGDEAEDEDPDEEGPSKQHLNPQTLDSPKSSTSKSEPEDSDDTETQVVQQSSSERGPASGKPRVPKTLEVPKLSVPNNECSVLARVYDDMGGTSWKRQDSWMGSSDFSSKNDPSCCSWFGVRCLGSRLVSLELGENGLTGAMSSALFQLGTLNKLNLTYNGITGALPDLFTSLPDLRLLDLDHNKLSGPLPPSLLSSASLTTLHLSNNSFIGPINLSLMKSIVNLVINRNAFDEITFAPNMQLQRIMISDNLLKGDLPSLINTMNGLKVFSAARNKLAGSIFELSTLRNLTHFDVQGNQLTGWGVLRLLISDDSLITTRFGAIGDFPASIGSLEALQTYHISHNQLSGTFPATMAPPSLISCSALPNNIQMCPPQEVIDNPKSLSAKCKVSCMPAKPKAETGGGGASAGDPYGSPEVDNGETKANSAGLPTGGASRTELNGMDDQTAMIYSPNALIPQQTARIDPETDPTLRYSVNESRRLALNVPGVWVLVTLSVGLLGI
ncbi:hypothetical protein FRC02_003021 [Tulasnella sp. 418]|nr:hypothetical protein FRC02_003021 [Tulasnella sp. 418]